MTSEIEISTAALLSEFSGVLYEEGAPYDIGCCENSIEILCGIATTINSEKKIRTIKDWQWWDLQIPNQIKFPETMLPVIVYSDCVMSDSACYLRYGNYVRSTPLVAIHDQCITETTNSFYILVGPGTRKPVNLEHALSFC